MDRHIVVCACGCGQTFMDYDSEGRLRRFVSGHNTTREFAQTIRARLTARPDARQIFSAAGKKAWMDADYRKRMLESGQRQWADPRFREKTLSAAHAAAKEKWRDPEFRQRMVEAGRRLSHHLQRPDVKSNNRRAVSNRLKQLWRTPEWIAKLKVTHASQCGTTRTSKPEKRLHRFISNIGHAFETDKRFVLNHGYTVPDAYIPSVNLAIFTDGTYWHGKPEKRRRDSEQREALRQMGVNVFVIDQGQPEQPQFEILQRTLQEMLCPA